MKEQQFKQEFGNLYANLLCAVIRKYGVDGEILVSEKELDEAKGFRLQRIQGDGKSYKLRTRKRG